jgi:hypothetical protein
MSEILFEGADYPEHIKAMPIKYEGQEFPPVSSHGEALIRSYLREELTFYRAIAGPRRPLTFWGDIGRRYDDAKVRLWGAWLVLRGTHRARPLRDEG